MSSKKETNIEAVLLDLGYNQEEISGVIRGLADLKNGKSYPLEEVKKILLKPKKEYA